jgi:hypothetical protein
MPADDGVVCLVSQSQEVEVEVRDEDAEDVVSVAPVQLTPQPFDVVAPKLHAWLQCWDGGAVTPVMHYADWLVRCRC